MANKNVNANSLPNQMVSSKVKNTKAWKEDTVRYFTNQFSFKSREKRKSSDEIDKNYGVVNSTINVSEMEDSFDPLGVGHDSEYKTTPIDMQFYNIVNNPLNTLIGEELKRRSDIKAIAINPDVVNQKDRAFRQRLYKYLDSIAQANTPIEKEQVVNDLTEIDKWRKHDLQTAHEVMANQIIQLIINDNQIDYKTKLNKAFKNLIYIGEEIVRVGHIGKEFRIFNVNSKNFYMLGLGESNRVEEGWAWVEENYMNPNDIIAEFGELLSKSQVSKIMSDYTTDISVDDRYSDMSPIVNGNVDDDGLIIFNDGSVRRTDYDNNLDLLNNIKVKRVFWKSLRKLGELTYIDEFGDEQKTFVDENYPVNEDKGESISWFYINEIMQGTEIMEDIIIDVKPCDVQMRSLINPAIVYPPYVGYIMSENNEKSVSLLDELIPYQKDYTVWMNKMKMLWTQNIGKVANIDLSLVPDNMTLDQWFYWMRVFKINFVNKFNESQKGQLAGHMQQGNKDIDLDISNEIAQAIQMLEYISQRVEAISGISRQRQGDINPREGLGTSQQAIVQSSHQTEKLFYIHDTVKIRLLQLSIEYIKVLWKDEKGKRQFMLDDVSNYIIDIDGGLLNEAEYGIQLTNSSRLYDMEQMLQQLTHAAMQNGTATLSDAARMFLSSSPSEMLNELSVAEEKRIKQQQQQQEAQINARKEELQQEAQMKEREHQMELEKIQVEWGFRLQEANIKQNFEAERAVEDTNYNYINDEVENDMNIRDNETKLKELEVTKELKEKELSQEERLEKLSLQSKERIAKMSKNTK